MKIKRIFYAVFMMTFSFFVVAATETTTGKVTILRAPTGSDVSTIYFRLDPMPQNVSSNWFYVRSGTGTSAGCSLSGSDKVLDRAYAMLLAAKTASKDVSAWYCVDTNGYGLVNGYLELAP